MKTKLQPQELRIALFGTSGAGKTTLLASYFGNQQSSSFQQLHGYRLEACDPEQSHTLLKHYYELKDGSFPTGTERFTEFVFALKLGDIPEEGLRIIWYDYPGGWWERLPYDESEIDERRAALRKLVTSQIGILLIDGEHYKKKRSQYVRLVLDQFKNEINRIRDDWHSKTPEPLSLPDNWMIALSKADLLGPKFTAEKVAEDIIRGASDQLGGLLQALGRESFGGQYLLLSSVKGEGDSVTDAHANRGLNLIAPLALRSIVRKHLDNAVASPDYGWQTAVVRRFKHLYKIVDSLDDFLPKKYQILTKLLKLFAVDAVLEKSEEHYRKMQRKATERRKILEATSNAMAAELQTAEAKECFCSPGKA